MTVGPAARKHFFRALELASKAEKNLVPGQLAERALMPIVQATIEIIRGIAYVFVTYDVDIKIREEEDS